MKIVEMMQHRLFGNPVLLAVPFSPNDERCKKRQRRRKPAKGGKKQVEVDDERVDEFFPLEIFEEDENFYEDNIEPLFQSHHFMIADFEQAVDEDDDQVGILRNITLLFPFSSNGTNEINSAMKAVFYIDNTEYMRESEYKISSCILIGEEPLTGPAYKDLQKYMEIPYQHFTVDEIQYPCCIFSSEYQLLSQLEANEILSQLNLKSKTFLPKLLMGDPVIKYFGWNRDDVIKIRRKSVGLPTIIDSSICYAVVVASVPKQKKKDRKSTIE
jgi:DNA-directed RNA polymerase subunit H (RpoH/RPB5)